MKRFFCYIIPAVVMLGFLSCERDDDEPNKADRSVARLYVSTSDYASGTATSINNIWVVDSVDAPSFPNESTIQGAMSPAVGGRTIHFSPMGGLLFQGGLNRAGSNDTAINVLSVNLQGAVNNRGRLANRKYDNVRGLYYTVVNNGNLSDNFLLALNTSSNPLMGSHLYAFLNPYNSVVGAGQKKARYEMKLNYTPWGIKVEGNDMYISQTGAEGAIMVYKDFAEHLNMSKSIDTALTVTESYKLKIAGANNIGGIAYKKSSDQFFVTDYSGTTDNFVGRILIFDKFSEHRASATITPSRIITGTNTLLKLPLDVAVDTREEGKYIYVADPEAKRVFRYLISDDGNVQPNDVLNIFDRAPQSISLDAR